MVWRAYHLVAHGIGSLSLCSINKCPHCIQAMNMHAHTHTEQTGKYKTDSPNWSEHLSDGWQRASESRAYIKMGALPLYELCVLNGNRLTMDGIRLECCTNIQFYTKNLYTQSHNHTTAPSNWQTYEKQYHRQTLHISLFSIFALSASCIIPETKLSIIVKTKCEKIVEKQHQQQNRKKSLFSLCLSWFIVVHNVQFRGIDGLVSPKRVEYEF